VLNSYLIFKYLTLEHKKDLLESLFKNSLNSFVDALPQSLFSILIKTFTDTSGSVSYNYILSEMRGSSIFEYIVNKGVSPENIQIIPRGELHTKEVILPEQKRRGEIILLVHEKNKFQATTKSDPENSQTLQQKLPTEFYSDWQFQEDATNSDFLIFTKSFS